LRGVLSLNETASRLTLPGELTADHALSERFVAESSLPPPKAIGAGIDYLCLNKINYALRCYPQHWLEHAVHYADTRAIVLFRNPFEIHRSRCNWVKRYKPQRVRWQQTEQLARDWLELCRMSVELLATGRARVFIHERWAGDREGFTGKVSQLCGHDLIDDHADVPGQCLRCGGALVRRQRYAWDPNDWLFCGACDLFLAGFGDYNFIREPSNENFDGWREKVDGALAAQFSPWLGEAMLEFFMSNGHLEARGEERLEALVLAERERHLATRLDDILYPY
jgi:hypothetical protein